MAFALPGTPFSVVLHTLRDQGNNCRSLSSKFAKHEKIITRTLYSSQAASRVHVALTAIKQQTAETLLSNDFYAAKTTFEQLGYDSAVCQAIKHAGLEKPSRVQVLPLVRA